MANDSFISVPSNVQTLIFKYVAPVFLNIRENDYVSYANYAAALQNHNPYVSFFKAPTQGEEVISFELIKGVQRRVVNWKMTCREFRELATKWYVMKLFVGKDAKRWIFLNVRSKMGYRIGIFEQRTICTEKESEERFLIQRVRNTLKRKWDKCLEKRRLCEGYKPEIVDVSTELNKLLADEVKEYEKQEGVGPSERQIDEYRETIMSTFTRVVRENARLKLISRGCDSVSDSCNLACCNLAFCNCRIRVSLTTLVIHACIAVTDKNTCHEQENMEKLIGIINDFERFALQFDKSKWCRLLKRTLPHGSKNGFMDVNIDEHGLRSKTNELCLLSDSPTSEKEEPGLLKMRELIVSSYDIQTPRDAFRKIERGFQQRCQSLGVKELINSGMRGHRQI